MFLRLRHTPFLCICSLVLAYQAPDHHSQTIQLTVTRGTPLRAYLTKRMPKRLGAPVEATTISPIFTFDRETIPSGSRLMGHVSRIEPVSKSARTRAILGGDFTPLHVAQVQFTSVRIPDGRVMQIKTQETAGLNTLYPIRPPKPITQSVAQQNGGFISSTQQAAKDQISSRVNSIRDLPVWCEVPISCST